mgnify:CR=1 FL=1
MHDSVLDLIGNTPLVKISKLNPNPAVQVYAKLEGVNPGGSIKDRVALAMVEAAERRGELSPDKVIIEATSGNTGIGLAMVCAVKGYRLMLLMPESASEERKRIMIAFGAEIHLTPGHLSTDGAIEEAYRLAREQPESYVLMDQFNNEASIEAHYRGTAEEILTQTKGRLTHVVASLGTSGTVMGLAKRMREVDPRPEVVTVEPYVGHKIQGLKNMQASYPPGIYDKHQLGRILRVDDEEAFSLCRELASAEGIFAGMSSGAALGGALKLARELDEGLIVVIFPDGGERYLSTPLFVPPSKQGLALTSIKSRSQEVLNLQRDPVSVFTPGPSPENADDPESWRRLVFMDILSRYLQSKGVNVAAGAGVADFDDQALGQARARGQTQQQFSAAFVSSLARKASGLGIKAVRFVPASSMENAMLTMCRNLLGKGRAYERLRSVYFDVFRSADYGELVRADLSKLNLGKTVDMEDYSKDNPRDFTLLKRATLQDLKLGEFIKTEWGNVRPSWTLQMAGAGLDLNRDVQVVIGGRNHRFPHLENLRAIWSKSGHGDPEIWMLMQTVWAADDSKERLDLSELASEVSSAFVLRLWLMSISYKKPLGYSVDALKMWEHNWKRVQNLMAGLLHADARGSSVDSRVEQLLFDLKKGLTEALEDDLRLYRFWPVLFDFCRTVNKMLDADRVNRVEAELIVERLEAIDQTLGIIDWGQLPQAPKDWPDGVADKVRARDAAKKSKDFATADRLRNELGDLGFRVEDTPKGTRLYRSG